MTNEREQALRLCKEAGLNTGYIEWKLPTLQRLISLAQKEATECCYSYAAENQQLHDRAEAAEKRVAELEAGHNAMRGKL